MILIGAVVIGFFTISINVSSIEKSNTVKHVYNSQVGAAKSVRYKCVAIEIMHSKSYFIVKYKEYIIFKLRFKLIFAKYS